MAQVTGTTDTFRMGTGGGLREDLEDKIWDLFADENWALSNLPRVPASGTFHEWETDVLVAATNIPQIEGDDASFTTVAAPTRQGNYCQITKKMFLVSGTLEAVKKAGRAREAARQTVKQMRELKNDMEYIIVRNSASSAGGSGTARATGGMESWISTNEELATTTSSATTAGFASGVVTAPTDGTTTGAFTEATFKQALADSWTKGGNASMILTGTSQKSAIDGFAGIAAPRTMMNAGSKNTIIGAADVYKSSFGTHTIVLHRHVRSTVVLCIDPDYWALAFLRNPFMEQLAKTGDGTKYEMIAEWALVCRNEKASAKVVSCN